MVFQNFSHHAVHRPVILRHLLLNLHHVSMSMRRFSVLSNLLRMLFLNLAKFILHLLFADLTSDLLRPVHVGLRFVFQG